MQEAGHDLSIFADYENDNNRLVAVNPGLTSCFPEVIAFRHLTAVAFPFCCCWLYLLILVCAIAGLTLHYGKPTRSCTALAPQLHRSCTAVAPHQHRTSTAPAPHQHL
jgi:hypothetical protein